MTRCGYQPAYLMPCDREIEDGETLCVYHKGKNCWCGAEATKECCVASSFVCGNPTCDEHECNRIAHGMTGSEGVKHSEKGYQQWIDWEAQREKAVMEGDVPSIDYLRQRRALASEVQDDRAS